MAEWVSEVCPESLMDGFNRRKEELYSKQDSPGDSDTCKLAKMGYTDPHGRLGGNRDLY